MRLLPPLTLLISFLFIHAQAENFDCGGNCSSTNPCAAELSTKGQWFNLDEQNGDFQVRHEAGYIQAGE